MAVFYLDEGVPEVLALLLVGFGHHATATRAEGHKDVLVSNSLTVLGNALYSWTASTGWR